MVLTKTSLPHTPQYMKEIKKETSQKK